MMVIERLTEFLLNFSIRAFARLDIWVSRWIELKFDVAHEQFLLIVQVKLPEYSFNHFFPELAQQTLDSLDEIRPQQFTVLSAIKRLEKACHIVLFHVKP